MERRVYKYDLPLDDYVIVEMPTGAKILSVHEQWGKAWLWALIDPAEARTTKRALRIVGTGHTMEYTDQFAFIGTVHLSGGLLVFHVFEVRH
jgi:hypothetical protein